MFLIYHKFQYIGDRQLHNNYKDCFFLFSMNTMCSWLYYSQLNILQQPELKLGRLWACCGLEVVVSWFNLRITFTYSGLPVSRWFKNILWIWQVYWITCNYFLESCCRAVQQLVCLSLLAFAFAVPWWSKSDFFLLSLFEKLQPQRNSEKHYEIYKSSITPVIKNITYWGSKDYIFPVNNIWTCKPEENGMQIKNIFIGRKSIHSRRT